MSGKKIAVLIIPVAVVAIVLSLIYLWPNLPNYLDYLMPGGRPPAVPDPTNDTDDGNGTRVITVRGLSTPSAFLFTDRWVAQYNMEEHLGKVQATYSNQVDSIGALDNASVEGLVSSSADFVITGNVSQNSSDFGTARILPISPQAIAIVYNVPGFPDVPSGLKLDPLTLSAILSGNATLWDDQRIAALNPEIVLPHQRIVLVGSPQDSAASRLVDQYVSASNASIAWHDAELFADNPSDVAAAVRRTPNSIAYVDFTFAVQTRMTYAALQNADGDFVLPGSETIGKAIMNGTLADSLAEANGTMLETQNATTTTIPTIDIGSLGNGSYPVVSFYYVVFQSPQGMDIANLTSVASNITEAERREAATIELVHWISGEDGQRMLGDLQYSQIYDIHDALRSYRDGILG